MNKDDIDYETIVKLINDILLKQMMILVKVFMKITKLKLEKLNYYLKMHLYIH